MEQYVYIDKIAEQTNIKKLVTLNIDNNIDLSIINSKKNYWLSIFFITRSLGMFLFLNPPFLGIHAYINNDCY